MRTNLKAIRLRSGKKQVQVAIDLHVPLPTYRTWEQGTTRLFGDTLVALSSYFNCSVDDILGTPFGAGAGKAPGSAEERTRAISNSAIDHMGDSERLVYQRLMASFLELSGEGQERLAEQAEMMCRSGMYTRFGRAKAFSDGDLGTRRETP